MIASQLAQPTLIVLLIKECTLKQGCGMRGEIVRVIEQTSPSRYEDEETESDSRGLPFKLLLCYSGRRQPRKLKLEPLGHWARLFEYDLIEQRPSI